MSDDHPETPTGARVPAFVGALRERCANAESLNAELLNSLAALKARVTTLEAALREILDRKLSRHDMEIALRALGKS